MLGELKATGVRLALDDFGSGYSSLELSGAASRSTSIKVDRASSPTSSPTRPAPPILAAIIQLAHGLGVTVVAKGVETIEQNQTLSQLGADFCQGFYLAEPMPNSTLGERIHQSGDRLTLTADAGS